MPPPVPDEGTPDSFATPQLSTTEPTSPTHADHEGDSDSNDDDNDNDNADELADNGVDFLVARTAKRIAAVINDFKRDLDQRDSVWGTANGTFELALNTDGSQVYELTIVHDKDGEEYPVTVRAKPKPDRDAANGLREQPGAPGLAPLMTAAAVPPPTSKRTRRDSDAALEKDIVSRKKRKTGSDDNGNDSSDEPTSRKRARTDGSDADADADADIDAMDEDMMPLITKDDLSDLLSKLRDDIQDDTTETVNHVQRLLRRFKEEWHERTTWEDEQASSRQSRAPFRDSISGAPPGTNGVAFPSPVAGRDDTDASTADIVLRESKLLSSQIRWVEECRRVASTIHDKREENWRTTSAGFHDRNRHDREAFQNRMLHESGIQGKVLNQILNEVKAIGLYTQSMKWETPDSMSQHHAYAQHQTPQMQVPAFPTQPQRTHQQQQSLQQSSRTPSGRGRGGGGGAGAAGRGGRQ